MNDVFRERSQVFGLPGRERRILADGAVEFELTVRTDARDLKMKVFCE
jgi:hypothetical protein